MEIKKKIYISKETDDKVSRFLSAKTEKDYQGADLVISLPVDMGDGIVMEVRCCGCDDEASYAEIVLFSHGSEVNVCAVHNATRFCGVWRIDYHGITYTLEVALSTLHLKKGNLLTVNSGIIAHQVNCQRVMGAGLALAIRRVYPKHYSEYLETTPELGSICATEITPTLYVVGVYGQDNFGRGETQTNYDALRSGFTKLRAFSKSKNLPVYLPYMIGCGLAGGNWKKVLRIIEETLPGSTILNPNIP